MLQPKVSQDHLIYEFCDSLLWNCIQIGVPLSKTIPNVVHAFGVTARLDTAYSRYLICIIKIDHFEDLRSSLQFYTMYYSTIFYFHFAFLIAMKWLHPLQYIFHCQSDDTLFFRSQNKWWKSHMSEHYVVRLCSCWRQYMAMISQKKQEKNDAF